MSKYAPFLDEWSIGEDAVFTFNIVDGADVPKDMGGKTVEFVVRKDADGELLFTKTAPDIVIATSVVSVTVSRATTIGGSGNILIPPGIYFYTLRQIDTGDVEDLAYGPLVLKISSGR